MKHIRVVLLVVVLAMVASACSLFGGDDDGTDLSTAETFTPEPTANVVQAVPADDDDSTVDGDDSTADPGAPLPTAVTIPATPEPTPDRSQPTTYVVQAGDVLGLIAERFDVDIAELRRVNDLSGNLIQVGQTLTIPALDGSTDTDETAGGPIGSTEPSSGSSQPDPDPEPVSCGANAVGHCIQPGDTLSGIASQYGVTVDALRTANPSIVGDAIRAGELLNIPGQSGGGSSGGSGSATTPTPTPDLSPKSDADCAALNPEFPYFHAADGLCYANPIGDGGGGAGTPTPTPGLIAGAVFQGLALPSGQECPENAPLYGQFSKDGVVVDGPACYPTVAAVVPTPTVGSTPTAGSTVDYGRPPCDPWEVVLETGKCWPTNEATEEQREAGRVTPTPTS